MADQIQENIREAFDKLEDKLKGIGFTDDDLEELKADLEVGMKSNASMADLIGILKESEKKVVSKSKNKTEKKVRDDLIGSTNFKSDYETPSNNIEESIIREAEEFEEEVRPVLEETINANNAYFANKKFGEEDKGFSYQTKSDNFYNIDEITDQSNTYQSSKNREEEEKKERESRIFGKRDDSYSENPQDTYK